MRNYVIFTFLIVGLVACKPAPKNDAEDISTDIIETTDGSNNPEPKFEFKESTWDFGRITEGEIVEHTFKFKNVGNEDLVISKATASCGCTIPEWSKEPIAPGESGKLKVEFKSAGKSDQVVKDITVYANTNPVKTMLKIKVFVEKNNVE